MTQCDKCVIYLNCLKRQEEGYVDECNNFEPMEEED